MAIPSGAEPLPGTAVGLRAELHFLLQEHTYLAGNTTDAFLNARQPEMGAAGAALNLNSSSLARLFGSLYGPAAEARFLESWTRHIYDYKRYAQGHVEGSDALRQDARADLESLVPTAESFLGETIPTLPAGVAGTALSMHVQGTLEVIDAQAARDFTRVYSLAREGATMSATGLADPLALAIASQFPDRFPSPGAPAEPGGMTAPNGPLEHRLLFQHHVFLASARMTALLNGRPEQAAGAGAALGANSTQLADRVQAVLGADSGARFLALWRAHLDALDAYAAAASRADLAGRQEPTAALVRSAQDLDTLLTSSPTGGALRGQIAGRLSAHVAYSLQAIDALAGQDVGMAYGLTGGAARQIDEIAARVSVALGTASTLIGSMA
jgi:hypothetical protein